MVCMHPCVPYALSITAKQAVILLIEGSEGAHTYDAGAALRNVLAAPDDDPRFELNLAGADAAIAVWAGPPAAGQCQGQTIGKHA